MTREDALEATREAALAATAVSGHLARMAARLAPLFPLSAAQIADWDDDPRERLHAMLRLFEQLYDLTGRRLMRGLLLVSAEDPGSLSASNLYRRVESLTESFSADRWMALGTTRNKLVHEYPISAALQARNGNDAWRDLADLLAGVNAVLGRLGPEIYPQ